MAELWQPMDWGRVAAARMGEFVTGFVSSATIQFRVVAALMLRESRTRFGKSQVGYLWSLAEPIAVVLTFSALFRALNHPAPIGSSLPVFFATGMLAYHNYRRTASFCSNAFTANEALLTFPIVQQVDTLISRGLLEFFTSILSLLLIFGALHLVWEVALPVDVGPMVLALAALSIIGFAHGSITAVVGHYFPSWPRFDELLSRPLFFVSGIFFVPSALPPSVRSIVSWNPLLHGVELMRSGYYPHYRSDTLDVGYLLGVAGVLLLVSLSAERVMRLRSERDN